MYTLRMQELNDDGEPDGPLIVLATVNGDKITGRMAKTVKQILSMSDFRLGLAGQTVKMDGRPWLVAAALTNANGDFRAAGFETHGVVQAFDGNGKVLAMPYEYRANFIPDVIDEPEIETMPVEDKSLTGVLLKAGRNVIAEALERLHAIPRVDNRHIDVPWPILPRPKLKPEEWAESTIESVMIESLFASQQLLTANRVEYYVKNPGAIEEGRRAFANVYSSNDGLVIVDGHHRLTALWLLGADMANVWFLSEGD